MKTLGFQTADELADYFKDVGNGVLFRGQTKEYCGADNKPHLSTSFSRKGCVPPHMLKWSYYGNAILRTFVKNFDEQPDLATDQAILQHYGWRSFFIDATSNPAVACWFAGFTYESKRVLNLAEDCFEDPAQLVHESATYSESNETGIIYVLSKKALRARELQAVDLAEIITSQGRPRYVAQSAWMVGPLDEAIPPDCIVAKILAPATALRDYAARSALRTQHDLFPSPDKDPVLSALLSVPWRYFPMEGDDDTRHLLFYFRGLSLPEYGWKAAKRHPASMAFYRPFWIANEFGPHEPFASATYLLTPEPSFYGTADIAAPRFPALLKLLRKKGPLVIEMDGLLDHPNLAGAIYGKGLHITLKNQRLLTIDEIHVEHPGMRPMSYGSSAGRSYEIRDNGTLVRSEQPDDCPCGNDALHNHHLIVASHVDDYLKEKLYKKIRHNIYAHEDVDANASLRHLKSKEEAKLPYFSFKVAAE